MAAVPLPSKYPQAACSAAIAHCRGTFLVPPTTRAWWGVGVGLVALALQVLGGCALFDGDGAGEIPANAVKVLACNPTTGSLSFRGPALEKSMQLAVAEINDGGGILGRPLHLIVTDSHSDEDAALAEVQFNYGEHRDITAIAGASLDAVSHRLLTKVAKDAFVYGDRIPMVSPASTSAEFVGLLDAQYNLFFRTVCSSHYEGRILADKARDRGFQAGVAVGLGDFNNKEIFKTFRERFGQHDGPFEITSYYYDEGAALGAISATFDTAFGEFRQRHSREPDFVLVLAYGLDGKSALNEWARKHSGTPLLLSDSLMSDYFLAGLDPTTLAALDGGDVNGVFPGGTSVGRGAASFAREFCGTYPEHCRCEGEAAACAEAEGLQPEIYAANAYDAIYVIGLGLATVAQANPAGIDRAGDWDVNRITTGLLAATNDAPDDRAVFPGEWSEALEALEAGGGVNYEGASSASLEMDLNGDPVNCGFSFWSITDGQIVFRNSEGNKESVTVSF